MNNLFPVTKKDLTSFSELKYLPGLPREYRFNAKTGELHLGTGAAVTKKGEAFSLIPIAYRIFSADMFNYEGKDWAEIFFINASGHISVLMVHGFSVDALRACMADLYYEGVNLCQAVITITPTPKSNEFGTYYIAQFSATPLPGSDMNVVDEIMDSTHFELFQFKTANANATKSASLYVTLPSSEERNDHLLESGE